MIKKVVALISCLTGLFMALEAQNLFDTPHPSLQKEWVDSVLIQLLRIKKLGNCLWWPPIPIKMRAITRTWRR